MKTKQIELKHMHSKTDLLRKTNNIIKHAQARKRGRRYRLVLLRSTFVLA